MPELDRGEFLRKAIHAGSGLPAFSLRYLTPTSAALWPLGGLLFNLIVLPRVGGKLLWRREELAAGRSWGILFYPLTVLLLILIFHRQLEVAAVVWGILAFGDGSAALAGGLWGEARLPWNPAKTWIGTLSYFVFGTVAGCALLLWTASGEYGFAFALGVSVAVALFGALLESLPLKLDDNLAIPLISGLLLWCLLMTQGSWAGFPDAELLRRLATGAVLNLLLAAVALAARAISRSGAIVGFALGTVVYACLGWRGYLLLVAFFFIGTAATRFGYRRKSDLGLAEVRGGRRSGKNAFANMGVATAAAFFALLTPHSELFLVAFAGAFAAATADTVESEIGQLWGGRPRLVTTWRRVTAGTDGAVSAVGTLAGALGSLAIAYLGWVVDLYPLSALIPIAAAGFLATFFESLVGATLERGGLLDNEAVNAFNTLAGALLAAGLASLVV